MEETDVFWVSKAGVVPYNKAAHATRIWNFLFWKNTGTNRALLIVGAGGYGRDDASHYNLRECFMEFLPELRQMVSVRIPDGAGNIGAGIFKKGVTWKSSGFGVITPDELQPVITELLGLDVA